MLSSINRLRIKKKERLVKRKEKGSNTTHSQLKLTKNGQR
jgi:hypothetical protein